MESAMLDAIHVTIPMKSALFGAFHVTSRVFYFVVNLERELNKFV